MPTTRTAPDPNPSTGARTTADTTAAPADATNLRARRSAVVAGVGILAIAVLAGVANFGVLEGLVTRGDATRTAIDVLASEQLFRLGVAALIVVAVLDVVVARALAVFLEPVHRELATLVAWTRITYAAIFAVAVAQLVGVPRLLGDASYLTTSSTEQRRSEAMLRIQSFHEIWDVSLVVFGLHLALVGYLALVSGYLPRTLGVLLVAAGGGYLVDSFSRIATASHSTNVSTVTFVGEALLMVWLLVKGRRVTLPRRPA